MKKMIFTVLCSLLLFHAPLFPMQGECADMVEIEYDGKVISVDMADLLLMNDEGDPEQLRNTPVFGEGRQINSFPETDFAANTQHIQGISEREYEEEKIARQWANIVEDLTLRKIDEKALSLVKEYSAAKHAAPPVTGAAGTLVISYSTYIPKIICRPMYVTDVILQPGEMVTGVYPGDPVRWTFVPGKSGAGDAEQVHVLIKPLMTDISTNLIINTDKRTYQLDLVASSTNHRVAEDMYIADKVFDSGALIVGTGARQDRVVIKRLNN